MSTESANYVPTPPALLAQVRQPTTLVGRPAPAETAAHPLLWPSLLALLCVAALLAIGVRARRRRACVPGRRALEVIANSLGLSPAERRMIRAIGGAEPAVIMISETAFRAFVERWAQTGPDESQRRDLVKLAGRLGWSGIFVESNRLEVKALPAARRAAAAPTLKLVA